MKNQKAITIIGLVLFCSYILQDILGFKITSLEQLQSQEMYKRWSGLALALFITFQWFLTFTRIIPKLKKHSIKLTEIHKWIGAFSPILFYIHTTSYGYGYLALLSYVFFANMLLGTINLDVIKSQKEWIFKGWMIVHVSLSMLITAILFLHIGTVFYYK
ncbi:hypothetical protein AXE80_01440 [Wenyingzhuangia fucanilytica]|uniref:Cytochrome b561 bacterial/Ni-hydrogenase domain-containing protein n=1 Tax=Wenyingzhuangia fucanilytica TaxID=1790137 RepID=A0A1B1Y2R5_9FLAO|nr:hypothetical protein [Wenyingzhuangia fucanilytica]ANW95038.1 hypothetical protein AXE80_01440 [Wenyingzhuangia fucanilytica]